MFFNIQTISSGKALWLSLFCSAIISAQWANANSESSSLSASDHESCEDSIFKLEKEVGPFTQTEFEGYTLNATRKQWLDRVGICNFEDAYYEIAPISFKSPSDFKFRMRSVHHTDKNDMWKISLYSPWMEHVEFKEFISELRSRSSSKEVSLGSFRAKKTFHKISLFSEEKEVELSSIEAVLSQRVEECKLNLTGWNGNGPADSSFCESSSYGVSINWVYNGFISYVVTEDSEGVKFPMIRESIVLYDGKKVEPIKDIRDLFSEKELLSSLKKDWIIRNSNRWVEFAKASSWMSFWDIKSSVNAKSSEFSSSFQSYSNRINSAQVAQVKKCADLAGKNTSINSGYQCLESKKPKIYMFNYDVTSDALSKTFILAKVNSDSVIVRVPLQSESTGTSELRLQVSKQGSNNDFFSDAIDL